MMETLAATQPFYQTCLLPMTGAVMSNIIPPYFPLLGLPFKDYISIVLYTGATNEGLLTENCSLLAFIVVQHIGAGFTLYALYKTLR
ncbi:hypothetical protein FKM82_008755 [Ascaphus truei]